MQQIINFLIRNKNFLLFLFLFALSLLFTIQSHSYHRSKFVNSANFLTGGVYSSISGIQEYFHLKTYNKQLLEENARLRENGNTIPSSPPSEENGLFIDSLTTQFEYIPAKVLDNNYSKRDNFILLKAGTRDSVQRDMGVISSKGIVGIIDNTSSKYSTVLSILNTNFQTNALLSGSNHFGTLEWDGKNPNTLLLSDIQRQAPVKVGDTIVTSGKSSIFPKGIPIGSIASFALDESENFYIIKVRLFQDMTNLGHAYVIKNNDLVEIRVLESLQEDE